MHRLVRPLAASTAIALGLAAAVASSPVGGDPTEALEVCAGDNDIADSTVIAVEFELSLHELIKCGGLQFALLSAVVTSAATAISDGANGKPPEWAFQDGAYKTTGTGVSMDIVFKAGSATPGFNAGDPIAADLFAKESYLTGAAAQRNGAEVSVSFTGVGPLVGLLGRGPEPTSPQVFTDEDLAALSTTIGSLTSEATIFLDDQQTKSHFVYQIDVPPDDVQSMLTAQGAVNNTEGATGDREDITQTMNTTAWDMRYQNLPQGLTGTTTAEVKGGPFDYQVTISYAGGGAAPLFTYSCL
jgi:hypothetical protein